MIIGIVAVAKNLAIGKDGKLPWHYSADLKFFKETTTGNAIVMGSNTWRSLGKALPNRLNVVLSRAVITSDGAVLLHTKDDVLALEKYLNCDIFIIGGASVFELFNDVIEKWYVTEIPVEVPDADVFMPKDFLSGFELENQEMLSDDLVVKTFDRK